ncbi:tripartite tricarboxylate transporter substrate binding protein [Bosea caraganae]|uniref:Tripartite tricarboxylate transporter substrate binding protein n=2 Tax=Bosea caraganae TaxID=2763117 RepID=A0A370LAP3_9HYPH|nr:tripartite tricarboxylate transporter substrate binding protein [Bosea caraganae]RDJ28271.1 tripartite tricarboxylate transporter substrate binding protein [Bosea caraganae]
MRRDRTGLAGCSGCLPIRGAAWPRRGNIMTLTKVLACALAFAGFCAAPIAASAQDYPSKPIRWIIPYNPGGATDASARILQIAIEQNKLLPQPIAAVNVGGAGGSIGARQVKDAPPDGYTILIHQSAMLIQEAAGLNDFGYKDFEPVISINRQCMVAGVSETGPYKTYKELMDAVVAKPRSIVWGGNIGSANHMAVAVMETASPGADFKKVQLGGAAESYAGIKGNIITLGNFGVGEIVAFRGGGLRPLAVLGEKRDPAIADVPTARELGYDAVFCNEHNLYAPKGTPKERIAVLAEVFRKALATQQVQKEFSEKLGMTMEVLTGDDLKKKLATELERLRPMTAGMKN